MDNLQPPAPPPSEVVTDLVFDFLGMAKPLVHLIREQDTFEDRGDHFYIAWAESGEDALVYKTQLLQFGRRVRLVQKVDPNNAVQKVVADIKKKEAAAQAAAGTVQGRNLPQAQAPAPQTSGPTVSPEDLWARSPLRR